MKKFLFIAFALLGAAAFLGAEGIAEGAKQSNEKADMSYAFGMAVAADLSETGLEFNYGAFVQGFRDVMDKEKTRYTMDEAMKKIDAAYSAAQRALGDRNKAEGDSFLAENSKRPGVDVTPSGLQFELVLEGSGEKPGPGDTVLVHYRGATINGTIFDTTYDNETPMEIPLDRVIPGWSEGLRMMREGGKAKLCIPPDLAYGERGAPPAIAPNAVLVFDVELLSIVQPAPEEDAGDDSGDDSGDDD